MKCPKCRGRMYAEKYYDFVRSFDAWKCITISSVRLMPGNAALAVNCLIRPSFPIVRVTISISSVD